MPRPDKATFIQEMLSEIQLRQETKPEPDSKEWWREVAQELGVKAHQAEAEARRLREELSTFRDGTVSNAVHDRHLAIEEGWRAEVERERDELRATTRRLRGMLAECRAFLPSSPATDGLIDAIDVAETDEDYPQCEQS